MVVARPIRGADGMGGHRNTTYTGVRGPKQPNNMGRRRERDRQRAQELARDLLRRTGYTASDAQGVDPEVRDPTGLVGVKSTNSPDRVELPPAPPR